MASLASTLEKLTRGNKRAEKIRRYIVVESIYQVQCLFWLFCADLCYLFSYVLMKVWNIRCQFNLYNHETSLTVVMVCEHRILAKLPPWMRLSGWRRNIGSVLFWRRAILLGCLASLGVALLNIMEFPWVFCFSFLNVSPWYWNSAILWAVTNWFIEYGSSTHWIS